MSYSLPDSACCLSLSSSGLHAGRSGARRTAALLRKAASEVSRTCTFNDHKESATKLPTKGSSKPQALFLYKAIRKAARTQMLNMTSQATDWMAKLRRTFATIDKDGSGFITMEELQEHAERLPLEQKKVAVQGLKKAARQADKNGDDQLDFEEFVELMSATVPQPRMWISWANTILSVLSVLLFFFLAPLVYCNLNGDEQWSVWDALYFAAVTLTTVGYGDLAPATDHMKVFTIFYILFAICIVAGVVNHSSEVVMGWYERRMKQVNLSVIAKAAEAVDVFADRYGCSCGFWILTGKRIGKTVLCMLLPVLVGSIVIGFNEDWSWLDALYWSVVTSTTVGYGDLKLTQESSRIFTTVYLLIGLSFIGAGVANLAALRVELHLASETRHMVQRFLAMDIVSELDLDGNGVDQCEFVCGMLLQLQLVDPSTVEGLLQMFEGLDSSGSGVLTHEGLTQLCVSRHPADPHTSFSRSLKAEATMAV